jgi:hypothetical protein
MTHLDELVSRYPLLTEGRGEIEAAFHAIADCYEAGGKVLVCGNGGSAADLIINRQKRNPEEIHVLKVKQQLADRGSCRRLSPDEHENAAPRFLTQSCRRVI